jgi:hypothetical protein
VVVSGAASEADLMDAAGLAAAYSDAPTEAPVKVLVQGPQGHQSLEVVTPEKDRFKERLV